MPEVLTEATSPDTAVEDILAECRAIKDELFALPSCRLTVGQILRLGDCEMFGLNVAATIPEALKLLGDFKRLRNELTA